MTAWSTLTSPAAFKSPAFIALVTVLCVALVLLLHHCVLVTCCRGGGGAERRRRRQHHRRRGANEGEDEDGEEEAGVEVSVATSRTHLVVQVASAASPAVVCRYRKEEAWKEPTCAVCLADFDDGEAVRVLPECMHYFHAECIDTWLRGSTSCPMCRAETTPTPSPASMHHHHRLDLSVSLEEILVRT
ncbi:putative RING zinc finger domain superfamily protein [Panicum miliaceum]|uniref:RING zinc finger domain superfamily protein n=1 Tax=Panicum miliaceum TaxID=4540 RepID=A0A3L6Q233_PANMI|nr:putative RING zinc finger domain superfamily protein [Panicum miliaceum]